MIYVCVCTKSRETSTIWINGKFNKKTAFIDPTDPIFGRIFSNFPSVFHRQFRRLPMVCPYDSNGVKPFIGANGGGPLGWRPLMNQPAIYWGPYALSRASWGG